MRAANVNQMNTLAVRKIRTVSLGHLHTLLAERVNVMMVHVNIFVETMD